MSKKDSENMLNRHGEVKQQDQINWAAQKDECTDFIRQFYDSIEKWLTPYVAQRKIAYDYNTITLNEDYFGTCNVKTTNINFFVQKIKIEPVGALLI